MIPEARRLDRWGGAALLVALAAACLFFYREFVFHGDRMLFGTDMLDQAYALRKFAVDELRAGRGLPLWNPFVYGGLPFLAVLPGPLFYPTSLLYLTMPLYRAIGWTFVLHTFLAGALGTFAARSFGLGRWAAAVTGVSYMFAGYLASTLYGGHDGRLFAMVLIPLAFGLLERGIRSDRTVWYLLLGLVVGLQILTPHVQVMYFSTLALSAYALFGLGLRWRRTGTLRPLLSGGGRFALAILVAVLVGAVQLWPTVGLLGMAVRGVPGQEGYDFASSWALPVQELSALVLPDLVGSLDSYWGANPFKLHTEYLGALPVTLAWIGLLTGYRRNGARDPRPWFFAGAISIGLLFALGAATPVHRLVYLTVPMIGRFRAPSMMLGPVTFAVALLAGFGWQVVVDARAGRSLPWPRILLGCAVLALPLAAAALAPEGIIRWAYHAWFPAGWGRQPPASLPGALRLGATLGLLVLAAVLAAARGVERGRVGEWACAGLLLLGALDLGHVGARYLVALPVDQLLPEDRGLRTLRSAMAPGERVWPLPDSYRPNELMYFEIPAVTGSQNFRLRWYERLVGGLQYENLGGRRALWSLLDLKYLATAEQLNLPFLDPVAEGRKGRVYRISDPTPHAFFPASVVTAPDSAAALDATLSLVDPLERAVVETWPYPGAPAGDVRELQGGAGTADVRSLTPNELILSVTAERPGLLFVSEIYHPSWRAWIDGSPVPIHRADVAFRAVEVPAGTHELVFRYHPAELWVGGAISAVAAALSLLAAGWLALRRPAAAD